MKKPKWKVIPNTVYPHIWYCKERMMIKYPTDSKSGWGYIRLKPRGNGVKTTGKDAGP